MNQGPRSAGRGRDQAGAVARYRLRGVLRRGRAGYLAIVLITGLLGGVAMGSVAAARRTQSAYPRILAASNPSDLHVDAGAYSRRMLRRIAGMRHVTAARTYVSILGLRTAPDGTINPASDFNQQVEMVGSLDGLYFSQDKVIVTAGRRADPRRADEVMVSDQTAQRFGLHVGQVLDVNLYTQQQFGDPDANPETSRARQARLTITGIGVFTDEVVQDDVDLIYRLLATPAFTRKALSCCAGYAWVGLKLDRGDRAVPAVQREFARLLPPGSPLGFRVTSVVEGQGERAIRPESAAAAVLGLIAALAAVVLAGQAIRRVLAAGRRERAVLRALGTSPRAIAVDLGLPVAGAVLAGTVLAGLVAVAVSPVAPLGPMHRLDPQPGFAADWAAFGAGAAVLLLVLGTATALFAAAETARTAGRRPDRARRGAASSAVARLNLPPGPAVGIGFAFEPAGDRGNRQAWTAITGTVVALVILVASVSFGASLGALVSHPSLYGWTWDREMLAGSGYGDIPPGWLTRALRADSGSRRVGRRLLRLGRGQWAQRARHRAHQHEAEPAGAGWAPAHRAWADRARRGDPGRGGRPGGWHGHRVQRPVHHPDDGGRDDHTAGHRHRARHPPVARPGRVPGRRRPAGSVPRRPARRHAHDRAQHRADPVPARRRPGRRDPPADRAQQPAVPGPGDDWASRCCRCSGPPRSSTTGAWAPRR